MALLFSLSIALSSVKKTEAATSTTIKFWTFQSLHIQFWQDVVNRWNKTHPNTQIKLDAVAYPYEDMHTKLLVALQSGVGAPDLVDIEINKFANFLKGTPQLVELNDLVNDVKDKFIQARLQIYSKNGKIYGLDYHVGAEVMYYNTELTKKAGVDIDKIVTWDDYVKAGQQIVKKTGKWMTTIETTDLWSYWPLISQQKSDFFDEKGNVIANNDINVKTLQFLQDLVYKYKIAIPAPGGNHHSETYWGFMNKGGAASVWMPIWYMGRFTDYMKDLKGKIAIRPMPVFKKGDFRSAGMGGTGTAIPKQSKKVAITKQLLKFGKVDRESQIKIWTILGFDPCRWDVWSDSAMKQDNKYAQYFTNGKGIFNTLLQIKDEIYPVHISEKTPLCADLLRKNVMYDVIVKKKSPKEVLDNLAKELKK
ncbi:extracellular solute-binding protein family 1 [Caldicellulosiruptor owensensis OL]|uniref:Extracellular solute-binding protein family 1 n=1 Tax=Caldicellulosiruptor owensensis (strain ATCC 700167 / DSM 13100 / OL) TaxID=632518 RepID=E4Q6I9_CALOW|nr:extracellular solute-binding protein [Caldicellulosiruptor owensensis]ADQ04488.1 extracellular solute-binding protein family 1 [Caldicellulosiruptor owensensis OL]